MKIGVGLITCDRWEYTEKSFLSIIHNKGPVEEIVIVNDGKKLPESAFGADMSVRLVNQDPPYQSVGVAKNKALELLLSKGCTDIFLVENDIIVKSPDVWNVYINASKASGIEHLNFGYHGPANRTPDYSKPNPRVVIDYPGGVKIALNPHSVGAFSYYTKSFIEKAGLHDTFFKNAWEHVELCQRAIKKGLLPAFWWFPDVAGSDKFLEEIPGSIQNSSITHTETWTANMKKGAEYYKKLHGWIPVHTPDTPLEIVLANLKTIYKNYKCT